MTDNALRLLLDRADGGGRLLLWSWQSRLLLGLTWAAVQLGHGQPPSVRHRVWFAGLLAVTALPAWAALAPWLPSPIERRCGPVNYMP